MRTTRRGVDYDNDYSWFIWDDAIAEIYENGVWKAGPFSYAANDVFSVAIEGSVAKYYQNGVLRYTSQVVPAFPLSVDAKIANLKAAFINAMVSGKSID